jgi:RIO kinase 1
MAHAHPRQTQENQTRDGIPSTAFDRFLETALFFTESQDSHTKRRKDSHRTSAGVTLDQATTAAITKLMRDGVLMNLGECISTGKDASVFIGVRGLQAEEGWPPLFAVKIRTAVVKFNPADGLYTSEVPLAIKAPTALAACAKAEYRSLTRLYSHGIPSPCPLMIHKRLLLMELITEGDAPAPTLANAQLTPEEYLELYYQILISIRRIFHRCGLVRADISEHTILVRQGKPVWIGSARVIDRENENASLILRRGITAITEFFQTVGIETAPLMRVFQFIVAENLEAGFHATIDQMRMESESMSAEEFVGRFMPYTLAEVRDEELAKALVREPGQEAFHEEEDESDDESDDEEEEEEEEEGPPRVTLNRKQFTREEWKAKLREIKQANKERRQAHKPQLERREQKRRGHRNAK